MHKINIYDVGTLSLITLYVLVFVILPYGSTQENGFETHEAYFENVGKFDVKFSTYYFGAGKGDYTIYDNSDYKQIIHNQHYESYSKSISSALLEKNEQLGNSKLSDRELFNSVISTIQHYTYIRGGDNAKNIKNTFTSKSGDCDELVLLAGGILSQMGYDVALIIYDPVFESDAGHMQLGVKLGSSMALKTIQGYVPIELTSPMSIQDAYMSINELTREHLKPTPDVIRYGIGSKSYG